MSKRTTKNTPSQPTFFDNGKPSADGLHTFVFMGTLIRAILDENQNPLFIANDVCNALNHTNPRMAMQMLPDDEKGVSKVYTLNGGTQNTNVVTESGLYRLIFRSNKAEAEDFRRWVLHEVLPSIRKTGAYTSKKERDLQSKIDKHDNAGLGNRPEIVYLKSKNDNLKTFKSYRDLLATLAEKPEYGNIFSLEYIEMFGTTAAQMEKMYGWKSVRDALPTLQLDYLTFAEKQLINILQMQKAGTVTNERVKDAIVMIVRPLGKQLRDLCLQLGIDHISGKPLLTSGAKDAN